MANKQQLEYVINVRAKTDEAIRSMKKLTDTLDQSSIGGNLSSGVQQSLTKIKKTMGEVEETLGKPITSIHTFDKLNNSVNDSIYQIGKIIDELNSLSTKGDMEKIEFVDKNTANQIKNLYNGLDKLQKKSKDILNTNKNLFKLDNDVKASKKNADELTKSYEKQNKVLDRQTATFEELKKNKANFDAAMASGNQEDADKYANALGYKNSTTATKKTKSGTTFVDEKVEEATRKYNELKNSVTELKQKAEQATASYQQLNAQLSAKIVEAITPEWNALANTFKNLGVDISSIPIGDFDKLKEALNNLTPEKAKEAEQEIEKLKQHTAQLAEQLPRASAEIRENATAFNQQKDAMDASSRAMDNFKNRVSQLTGLTGSVLVFRKAINSAFQTIKELDATMTETAVVTDFSVSNMWGQLAEYTQKANELGVAINDVYEASTLYYQQGLSTAEVNAVTTQTLKMARIAGLDAAEATDRMTAALRGFNKQFTEINDSNASTVADVYSKLAAITASNVDEISTAMSKVASLANSANMSFENTSAFLAQIIETTRESAETAGTALKTVIARFAEIKENPALTADSEGAEISYNKIDQALKSVGISLDAFMQGQEGLDQVFLRLAQRWDSLDTVTQRYIATQAAGSRQQSRFIALMSDYARTQELAAEAMNATGAADQQYAKTMDSLQTKLQLLKNAWNEFTTSILNSDLLKTVIDSITKIIEKINDLTGDSGLARLAIVFGTLSTAKGVLNGLLNPLGKINNILKGTNNISGFSNLMFLFSNASKSTTMLGRLTSNIKDFKTGMDAATVGMSRAAKGASKFSRGMATASRLAESGASSAKVAGASFKSLKVAMKSAIGSITAVTVGFAALVFVLVKLYQHSFPGLLKKSQEIENELSQAKSDLDETNTKLKELNDQINALQNKGSLTLIEQSELDKLNLAVADLEYLKKQQEKDVETKQEEANQTHRDTYDDGLKEIEYREMVYEAYNWTPNEDTFFGKLITKQKDQAKTHLDSAYVNTYKELLLEDTSKYSSEELKDYYERKRYITTKSYDNGTMSAQEYLDANITSEKQNYYNKRFAKLMKDIPNGVLNKDDDLNIKRILGQDYEIYLKLAGGNIDKLREHIESYAKEIENVPELEIIDTSSFKGAISNLNTISQTLNKVGNAYKEFNEQGKLSSETITQLYDDLAEIDLGNLDFEELSKKLSSSNANDIQQGFNDIATAYLNTKNALTDLNEETKQRYINELKALGITNADVLVTQKLAEKQIQAKISSKEYSDAVKDITNSSGDQQKALALTALQYDNLQSKDFRNWALTNINSFNAVAEAAGYTGETLAALKLIIEAYNNGTFVSTEVMSQILEKSSDLINQELTESGGYAWDYFWAEYEKLIKKKFAEIDINTKYTGTSDAKSDANEIWVSPLEKHYNLLQKISREQQRLNHYANQYAIITANTLGDYSKLSKLRTSQLNTSLKERTEQSILKSLREQDLLDLNRQYSDYKQYMYYDQTENRLVVDQNKWDNLKLTSDSDQAKKLNEIKEAFESALDLLRSTEDDLDSINQDVADWIGDAEDTYVELTNTVVELLIAKEQESIDLQQEQLDNQKEANEALLNSIQSNFTKLRQDRQNEESENDIESLTRRLAYLRQDTSGSNSLEIKRLEKELREKTQSYSDTLIDQSLEDMNNQLTAETDQQQKLIDNQQAQLDWMEENGGFNDLAEKYIKDAVDSADVSSTQLGLLISKSNDALSILEQQQKWTELLSQLGTIDSYLQNLESLKDLINKENSDGGNGNKDYLALMSQAFKDKDYESLTQYANEYIKANYNGTNGDLLKENIIKAVGMYDTLKKNGQKTTDLAGAKNTTTDDNLKTALTDIRDYFVSYTGNYVPPKTDSDNGGAGGEKQLTKADFVKSTNDYSGLPETQYGANGYNTDNKKYTGLDKVQAALKAQGYDVGSYGANGYWGPDTKSAITKFQNDAKNEFKWDEDLGTLGVWGPKTKKAFDYYFKTGGLADFTGPAWLDGTPSAPELVLNATDTENFIQLKDILRNLMGNDTNTTSIGDSYFDIDINIDELADDYGVDDLVQRVKDDIMGAMNYRTNKIASVLR